MSHAVHRVRKVSRLSVKALVTLRLLYLCAFAWSVSFRNSLSSPTSSLLHPTAQYPAPSSAAMPDSKLAVSLLTPGEAGQYMCIRHVAFVNDVNKILYFHRHEPSQATLDRVTQSIRAGIAEGILYLKCVDTSNGEIIAGARWRCIRPNDPNATSCTSEEVDTQLTVPDMYTESHPDVWRAFYELFNRSKRKHMGARPYWVLETLVTHPDHHRRGAGGLLLKWGCDKADEASMETYLEASGMGEPLYRKYGFEPVENIALDLRSWGGPEEIRWTVCCRLWECFETR